MKELGKAINQTTKAVDEPSGGNTGNERRRARVAQLLSAAAALGTVVLIAAMSGPKLPKALGE